MAQPKRSLDEMREAFKQATPFTDLLAWVREDSAFYSKNVKTSGAKGVKKAPELWAAVEQAHDATPNLCWSYGRLKVAATVAGIGAGQSAEAIVAALEARQYHHADLPADRHARSAACRSDHSDSLWVRC